MLLAMIKTTLRLDDDLMARAKREALRRGTTVSALIEEGLRSVLRPTQPSRARQRITLPVSEATGGTLPGIDLDDLSGLLDKTEGLS